MISDDNVRQLFQNYIRFLAKLSHGKKYNAHEFFRGKPPHLWRNQHPGGCTRHLSIFDKFNVIPKYCFDCYKILVEPRTVMELFKLMIVFDKIKLKDDNTRKCTIEGREGISGTYKGFVYCRSIKEGEDICKKIQEVISDEISDKIQVNLKRGCSEYALAYPEFAQAGHGLAGMHYKEEWEKYEKLADKDLVYSEQPRMFHAFNSPMHAPIEAQIMLFWLKYAATIGDLSYLNISSASLTPFTDLERPPFQPPQDE